MRQLSLLFPIELLPLAIVAAGLAWIVGARRLGNSLLILALVVPLLPVVLDPLFDALPPVIFWIVVLLIVAAAVATVFTGLSTMVIGRKATEHMVGTLAADVVRAMLKWLWLAAVLPLRVVFWLAANLLRR